MFTSLGLFKEILCPEHPRCPLACCIYAHGNFPSTRLNEHHVNESLPEGLMDAQESPRKRQRLDTEHLLDKTSYPQAATVTATPLTPALRATTASSISPPPLRKPRKVGHDKGFAHFSKGQGAAEPQLPSQAYAVSLNPRILPNPPASHATRMQLLKLLYEHLSRLNEQVKVSDDPEKGAVELSHDELVLQALKEEEAATKGNASVYANVLKLRILRLQKMKLPEWKQETLNRIAIKIPLEVTVSQRPPSEKVDTELDADQEIALLPMLFAREEGLENHGYVNKKPTEVEVERARKGLEAAYGWEECDRCKTRFQVFPGRRQEDGALTSGGQCTYHSSKPRRPTTANRADKSSRESQYACCKENVGTSAGCTKAPSHVFKVSNPARLELIMPFAETSIQTVLTREQSAVCFDCEMGYTTRGLELIRLTATSFPQGNALIDVLVRPLGEILDLNSRYSGVWPHDFANALPYDVNVEGQPPQRRTRSEDKPDSTALPIVESPSAARDLLLAHLSPLTPLIGHALDNDLNATRIIHPSIVDTVLLFPHPRGLPIRFGLKMLTKKYLNRDIQIGDGSRGHDSKEDAIAAGDLVRCKIKELWANMRREGWAVEDQEFIPPEKSGETMQGDVSKAKSLTGLKPALEVWKA